VREERVLFVVRGGPAGPAQMKSNLLEISKATQHAQLRTRRSDPKQPTTATVLRFSLSFPHPHKRYSTQTNHENIHLRSRKHPGSC
jgi:hypothetical protein